ncbi:unnamed protein product, partial [Closterium sp. Naga37s-1]
QSMWRHEVAMPRHAHIVLLLALLCICREASAQLIQPSQEGVLMEIVDEWGMFGSAVSWLYNNDCQAMRGIACTSNGFVTSVKVVDQAITKPIPNAISGLSYLRSLTLVNCQVSGSLPSALFTLRQLTRLDLNYNSISGSIPADISKLSNLEYLSIQVNLIEGTLPRELSHLKKVQFLGLSSNTLSGPLLDFFSALPNISSLRAPSTMASAASGARGSTGGLGSCWQCSSSLSLCTSRRPHPPSKTTVG